ncbi:hypothetical protein GGR54DRAFT_634444 [Hypoxylon sp. NC1633]|nr:hypothetical protein GGR54DRAFT_634444 [Hypoxylon sp. NC1633]
MSSFGAPVNPENPGASPAVVSVSWALTIVAMVTVFFRFYLRKKLKITLSWDDWIMLVAMVLQIGYQIAVSNAVAWGLGKATTDITVEQFVQMTRWSWSWIATPFSNLVSVLARISITILLVRIFGTRRWFRCCVLLLRHGGRWFMILFTSVQTILGVFNTIIIWVQCKPVEGLWDFRLQNVQCWDRAIQQYVSLTLQIIFALSDLFYVLFPVTCIWKLNMALRKRVGLGLLMGLSIITMGAALSKVVTSLVFSDANPFAGTEIATLFTIQLICTAAEQTLVITIGCIPTLRPLAKLSSSFLNTIASSLASLVSRTGRRRGNLSESPSYRPKYDRSGYEDLELRPPLAKTSGETDIHAATVDITAYSGVHTPESGNIRRTDNFSVTYLQQAQPKENV